MTLDEIILLVEETGLPCQKWQWKENEEKGYTMATYPRCVVWPYVHSCVKASGDAYMKTQTVQISVYSKNELEEKVLGAEGLENILLSKQMPYDGIYQEFNETDQVFHYYLGIDNVKR